MAPRGLRANRRVTHFHTFGIGPLRVATAKPAGVLMPNVSFSSSIPCHDPAPLLTRSPVPNEAMPEVVGVADGAAVLLQRFVMLVIGMARRSVRLGPGGEHPLAST